MIQLGDDSLKIEMIERGEDLPVTLCNLRLTTDHLSVLYSGLVADGRRSVCVHYRVWRDCRSWLVWRVNPKAVVL